MISKENPAAQLDGSGNLTIAALRPKDCVLEIELSCSPEKSGVFCEITERENGVVCFSGKVCPNGKYITIPRLINYIDYCLSLTVLQENGNEMQLPLRLFRCGYLPGRVVAYCHPDDTVFFPSGRFIGAPSLVRLENGTLLASHDIFAPDGTKDTSHCFRSTDNGLHWEHLCRLDAAFWGKLFLHRTRLFFLCLSQSYGDLRLYESVDGGVSWSPPAILLSGGDEKAGGPHRAPAPLICHAGRLWAAVEFGSWESGGHAAGVISMPENADPMDAAQWTCSSFLPYNESWPGTSVGECEKYLEGNMLVSPKGKLINFLRYQCRHAMPNHGRAILLEINSESPALLPQFYKVVDFPGNASKFSIQWDALSGRYWALCNRIVTDTLEQRNLLSLFSSPDLLEWKLERDMINYVDNGWFEDERDVGFQYPDWIFDDEDILFLSRTAVNGAVRYHDSNFLTFHRIRNFRR